MGRYESCQDFWAFVKPTFGAMEDAHRNAIFKRCITLAFTPHRVVLRLPAKEFDAPLVLVDDPTVAGDSTGSSPSADTRRDSGRPHHGRVCYVGEHRRLPDADDVQRLLLPCMHR